jgi:hypothetical protein
MQVRRDGNPILRLGCRVAPAVAGAVIPAGAGSPCLGTVASRASIPNGIGTALDAVSARKRG